MVDGRVGQYLGPVPYSKGSVVTVTISPQLLQFITGAALPILIGAVVKSHAPSWVKRTVSFVVCGLATLGQRALENKGIITQGILVEWAEQYLITIAAYVGLYKDTALGNISPHRGIGPSVPETWHPSAGGPPPLPPELQPPVVLCGHCKLPEGVHLGPEKKCPTDSPIQSWVTPPSYSV